MVAGGMLGYFSGGHESVQRSTLRVVGGIARHGQILLSIMRLPLVLTAWKSKTR